MPPGITTLLEIAAGNREACQAAASAFDRPLEVIQKAAAFFIEQVMLTPEADSYRVLGAAPDASSHELRRNMALLLRWLHPDTGDADGRSAFAGRVTSAWENLKTPERRLAYDRELTRRQVRTRASRPRRARALGDGTAQRAGLGAVPAQLASPDSRGARLAGRFPTRQASLLQRILQSVMGRTLR
jgi:hypothetical protein